MIFNYKLRIKYKHFKNYSGFVLDVFTNIFIKSLIKKYNSKLKWNKYEKYDNIL